jgi:hypothetical protein
MERRFQNIWWMRNLKVGLAELIWLWQIAINSDIKWILALPIIYIQRDKHICERGL